MDTEGLRSRDQESRPAADVAACAAVAPAIESADAQARSLARALGNRAFARLVARRAVGSAGTRTLQRVGGWPGAAAAANQAETQQSGYRRIPIAGLKPVDKAIVYIPPKLDPTQPVDVLVHLHGQNEGYKGDPPRDLDPVKDRIPDQLAAAGRPQLVAVLPQGSSSGADYGEFSQLDPRKYATDALKKVAALDAGAPPPALSQAPAVQSVVLSGHSGGGFAIKALLDKPALAKDLGGVVWFDAVQAEMTIKATGARVTTGQREAAKTLISTRIADELDAAAKATVPAKVSLATGFSFRLYYDAGGFYGGAAQEVDKYLKGLFGESGPVPPGQGALAARIAALDPDGRAALRARYQVLPIPRTSNAAAVAAAGMGTTGHENVIGSGALENALKAMPYGAAPPAPAVKAPVITPAVTGPPVLAPLARAPLAGAPLAGARGLRPAPRVVLARAEDVAARLIDTAAARGRSGPTPEAGKSLLTVDYIRSTLQGRAANARISHIFDVHAQSLQATEEGAQRNARYDSEAGLLLVELEDQFIHDPSKSAIDLLPPDRAAHYRGVKWGVNDYPGNGGANAGEAAAMASEMAVVRPERRPNIGANAVIARPELTANLSHLRAHLKNVDGQPGQMLFDEAAEQFSYMAAIAALDGVTLTILSSWRDPAVAAKNASASGNPAAVASYSSHSLGLAVDLQMSGGGQHFDEISTHPMSNVFGMRASEVHKWMVFRGAWFGWYPYGNEPWHWEYNPSGLRDRYRAAVIPQKAAPAAAGA